MGTVQYQVSKNDFEGTQDSSRVNQLPPWTRSDNGQLFSLTLYHGTTVKAAQAIRKQRKLRPSSDGRIGKGVYFTDSLRAATDIAIYRSKQQHQPGYAIICCRVIAFEKNCRKDLHPAWPKVTPAFFEYCFQEGSCNITEIKQSITHRKHYRIEDDDRLSQLSLTPVLLPLLLFGSLLRS